MNISPVQPAAAGAAPIYLDYNCFCDLADGADDDVLQLQGTADPLLHLHFFHMVCHAVERGKRVTTTTPLTVFPEYRARECVASGLYAMYLAMDAPNAPLYRALHGKDCFEKVLRNVRRLMIARASAGMRRPRLFLACTVTRCNLAKLPELVQLAFDEKFDGMRVQWPDEEENALPAARSAFFQTMRRASPDEELQHEDPERVAFYFGRARVRARTLDVELRLPPTVQTG